MNAKKKLLFSFAGLILSIAIFSTVVFAWFSIHSVTSEFVIQTGNLETDTVLYHAKAQYTDDSVTSYKYTEVVSQEDASKLFTNMIPGQIITFQLELTNKGTSTISAEYTIKFGDLFFGTLNVETGVVTWGDALESVDDLQLINGQHLLHAIHVKVYQIGTVQKNETNTDITSGAYITDVDDIQGVVIANPEDYSSDADQLSSKIAEANKSLIDNKGILAVGDTDVYIIKFYFNPVYGKFVENAITYEKNSNNFRNQAFKVECIYVDYTQKQQITE